MGLISDNAWLGRLSGSISRPTKGSLTAVAQTVVLNCDGYNSASIAISGTYVGAITFEGSVDGTNYFLVLAARTDIAVAESASTTLTNVTRSWIVNCAQFTHLRARMTVFTSGSMSVTLRGSGAAMQPVSTVGNSVSTAVTQSTGSTTAAWLVAGAGIANNLTTTTTVNSAASTNGANVKTTAGTVYNITAHNVTAATKYIRLYNKASTPTVGTDVPIVVVAVPASSSKEITSMVGVKFSLGIGHAITNGAAATDATAVAAGDVQLAYSWI